MITDDEMLKLATEDRAISREELGIKNEAEPEGLNTLPEGFDLSFCPIINLLNLTRFVIDRDKKRRKLNGKSVIQ